MSQKCLAGREPRKSPSPAPCTVAGSELTYSKACELLREMIFSVHLANLVGSLGQQSSSGDSESLCYMSCLLSDINFPKFALL